MRAAPTEELPHRAGLTCTDFYLALNYICTETVKTVYVAKVTFGAFRMYPNNPFAENLQAFSH